MTEGRCCCCTATPRVTAAAVALLLLASLQAARAGIRDAPEASELHIHTTGPNCWGTGELGIKYVATIPGAPSPPEALAITAGEIERHIGAPTFVNMSETGIVYLLHPLPSCILRGFSISPQCARMRYCARGRILVRRRTLPKTHYYDGWRRRGRIHARSPSAERQLWSAHESVCGFHHFSQLHAAHVKGRAVAQILLSHGRARVGAFDGVCECVTHLAIPPKTWASTSVSRLILR